MPIVDIQAPFSSEECGLILQKLTERYPFFRREVLTQTAWGRPVQTLTVGQGERRVLFTAAHHANEWITSLVLLRFAEDLAQSAAAEECLGATDAAALLENVCITLIPLVDPDGVDLVTGVIEPGSEQYLAAQKLAANYPDIPFPAGWKANLLGTDLNLNYPAGWLNARQIKFMQGYVNPAPRDYVGKYPLDQQESRALAAYTEYLRPDLVLALHTQGEEIYWQFEDIYVEGAYELGKTMAELSGYRLADTPYSASFAGYKDWFIRTFRRPGYTIEAGRGQNPLPITDFPSIYEACLPILLTAAQG